jgi:hypothetical protein
MPDYAVTAMVKKRTTLARDIDQRQGELVNLLSDLNALDCAIRLSLTQALNYPKSS